MAVFPKESVINIIVHELLGTGVPNNTYISGSKEWSDVEVQNQVDQRFMLRLMNYCVNTYERYEVLPVVLVFVVENFSKTILVEKSFIAKESALYILETQCEHWAKSANFVSAKSIENYIQDSMDPFVALAYFTSSQAQDLKSLTFAAYSKVLDQATNKVQEIIEIQDEDPILMLEEAKNFAKEFLGTMEDQKRKLSEEYELDL